MTKQLTIAMPSYNVEALIGRGLESLADPRLADALEVVVVDDGSTDGTADAARRFVEACPDVFRLVSKTNGGHGSAVNAGLDVACGRYFRVVDADDWVDADGLAEELSLLRRIDSDIVVDVRRDVHMETGETELKSLPNGLPLGCEVPFSDISDEVARTNSVSIHTVSGRTDFLRSCGVRLLERTFYVDTQFIVEATSQAATVTVLDIEVYQYLVGNAAQSVAAESFVARFSDHDRVVREVCRFVEERLVDPGTTSEAAEYLRLRARLLVNTHYNVMLVYDRDRRRGRARARSFRAWLGQEHPWLKRATDGRYFSALAAGVARLDAASLDRMLGRMNHEAQPHSTTS